MGHLGGSVSKRSTSAQVMISRSLSSSLMLDSVLTAKRLERASDSVSPSLKNKQTRGAWVARSVKRPTSAQVMISRSVGSSPALGSVLTAQSLEPVSDCVSPSL